MNIALHVERVILDGLPMTRAEGELLRSALEAELLRLVADGRLADGALSGFEATRAPLTLQLERGAPPETLGRSIARELYAALDPAPDRATASSAGGLAAIAPSDPGGGAP
jgi:hypothetical protein